MRIGSISGSLTQRIDGESYLVAGTGVTITSGSNGSVEISAAGGGGGSSMWTDEGLFGVSQTGSLTIGGDGGFGGFVSASLGFSGSLTRLTDGSSYLVAGTGVTITSGSNGSVEISVAGGGATLGYFEPRATPTVPNASDEEFNGPNPLTLFDPLAIGTTLATSNSLLRVSAPSTSPERLSGGYKATPAGEFSAWTVLTCQRGGTNTSLPMLGITSAVPTALVQLQLAFQLQSSGASAPQFYLQNYTNLTTFSSTVINARLSNDGPYWIRLRYLPSSTRLSWDLSGDGVNWTTVTETTSPFVTPNYIIIGGAGGAAATYSFDFLRFSNSAAPGDLTLGRVV